MKKSFFTLATLLVVGLLVQSLFVSCSSDPEEEEFVNTEATTTRLEVIFSGDYAKFSPTVQFSASDYYGGPMTMNTSDKTDEITYWTKNYEQTPFTSLSALVKGRYLVFNVEILLSNPGSQNGSVTIKGNVYKDDKLYKTYTETIDMSSEKARVVLYRFDDTSSDKGESADW